MPMDPFLENRILSADPVELVQILYEHAINLVRDARSALAASDIVGRSRAISRTIGILGELEGSLDKEKGGAISQNLAALYKYMRTRLTVANLKQQDGPLAEVETLLQTLGGAWKTVQQNQANGPTAATATPTRDLPMPLPGAQFLPDLAASYADHSWTA